MQKKLFHKIGEVASMLEVEPYVLRYWESEFNLKLTKSQRNQRLYHVKDIAKLTKIKTLLYEERFTIAGAKKKLRENRQGKGDNGQMSLAYPPVGEISLAGSKEFVKKLREEIASLVSLLPRS